ncbi:MAG TPA: AraC family transcriptional regulator [Aliidongia sp.]|uniref:AraC family transcriptional regulator n=1 Tax=Aliidongia sp. TaxID=1914230 RepID=UPI002DDD1607|nr:AraC family transcriptional regulator [Aliidongia sp.]HEV2678674.1 AraC family transcriptional regulator [Aliidongia sp.]
MFERLDSRFDVLTQVLEAVHLGSAMSARTELRAPWALHFGPETGHRAGFHVVTGGWCWVRLDGTDAPIMLGPGDVIVLPHGTGHTLGDRPDTPAIELAERVADLAPGQRVMLPSGDGDPTTLFCGSYSFGPDGTNPLLRGLPDLLHIPTGDGALSAAVLLLAAEAAGIQSGSALVVDRLVDLLFVYALRTWLIRQDDGSARSWFGGLQDAVVGPAVRAIHDDPACPWTVESLARHAGVSRAAFARRFNHAVGEPPLAYVTRWRMTVAAGLLEQGERIAAVAPRVGYDNEFAFAKAFKRVRGIAPGQHRLRQVG